MSLPAKFDQYEIFRILIPGYYFVSLTFVFLYINPIMQPLVQLLRSSYFSFVYIIGGIIMGIIIYAYDYPSKKKFIIDRKYNSEMEYEELYKCVKEQLCDKCKEECNLRINTDNDAESTYFLIQYNVFDHKSQDVIQYFRSIYRVISNIRFLSKLFYFVQSGIVILYIIKSYNTSTNLDTGLLFTQTGTAFIIFLIDLILWKFNKGEIFLRKSVEFQKNYIERYSNNIQKKICPQFNTQQCC